MAERSGVGQLVLTHFRVQMDEPERYGNALRELSDAFSGPVSIAEDLEIYSVSIDKVN